MAHELPEGETLDIRMALMLTAVHCLQSKEWIYSLRTLFSDPNTCFKTFCNPVPDLREIKGEIHGNNFLYQSCPGALWSAFYPLLCPYFRGLQYKETLLIYRHCTYQKLLLIHQRAYYFQWSAVFALHTV